MGVCELRAGESEDESIMRDALFVAVVLAFFAFCMWNDSDDAQAAPPAPCVCEDVDGRVAAELAAQSAAVLDATTHAAELTDTVNAMRAACFFSPASHLGVRPIRRVK